MTSIGGALDCKLEAGQPAEPGEAAVRADGQRRTEVVLAVSRAVVDAPHDGLLGERAVPASALACLAGGRLRRRGGGELYAVRLAFFGASRRCSGARSAMPLRPHGSSQSRPWTAAPMTSRTDGILPARSARKSRNRACGIIVMYGNFVRQPVEIGQHDRAARPVEHQSMDLRVRQRQQPIGEAEGVHQLHRGRVDGVAAKVALEVLVLFQDGRLDAGLPSRSARTIPAGPPPTIQQWAS